VHVGDIEGPATTADAGGESADAPSFSAWVAPHVAVLAALAVREVGRADAEDLVQDALVRAWRRRTTYRPDRGSARAWVVAVLRDQARRRRMRYRPLMFLGLHRQQDDLVDASVRVEVEQALAVLTRRQREVITLHYLADLPVTEVATVLGISEGAVKAHLFQARSRMRTALEE
jgi:RNA polymerase sigma-70 factor (ECF subfamily)